MTRSVLARAWLEGASLLTLAELLNEDPRALEDALRLQFDDCYEGEDQHSSSRGVTPSPAQPQSPPAAAAEAEPASTPPAGSATCAAGPCVAEYEEFLKRIGKL